MDTLIGMRRSIHTNIYNEYRKEKCTKNGEQTQNLTESQKTGMQSLKKRMQAGEIVILKTDKSGKLCVATMEEYIRMGQEHAGKDEIIGRKQIEEMEKEINGHSTACEDAYNCRQQWSESQRDRVIDSKNTKSKNLSTVYLVVKDHKKKKESHGLL